MKIIPLAALMTSIATVAAASGAARYSVHDTPSEAWSVQGADDGRFQWLPGRGVALDADSNAPSSRLLAPLPFTLDGTTSFRASVDLVLRELVASPTDFFQVSVGLVNASTTGLNRTGTSLPAPPFFLDDADTFDSVELAYFPNVTAFGGPTLSPGVFGAQAGDSAFWNFAANFGPSADLGDNVAPQVAELPVATRLRVELSYDACSQLLRTRVLDLTGRPVELETGLLPVDVSVVNATATFHVDALAVNAYRDFADGDPSSPSLEQHVDVLGAEVVRLGEPGARLVPGAVSLRAKGPAHVIVEGASVDELRIVEIGGAPADLPLDAVRVGGALHAAVDRATAAAGFVIDAGGCRLAVPPARTAPR